jgi:hypothetical protein
MADNVLLLGAGASFDAGIPLLGSFMDRIFELASLKRSPARALTAEELEILNAVIDIRDGMERYQPRVAINQFNLEQVLSILSFEALVGAENGVEKLEAFKKAISLTIELTCSVTHHGKLNSIHEDGPAVYREFWKSLFSLYDDRLDEFPTILTFNYDLVLERSLMQHAIGVYANGRTPRIKAKGFHIDYCSPEYGNASYLVKRGSFTKSNRGSIEDVSGNYLQQADVSDPEEEGFARIPLLKLHGSLNFSHTGPDDAWSPVKVSDSPQIIPPVFNKADSTFGTPIWKAGLEALRTCKNLIVCGYSLPTSDSYMQYFLKAALGPNRNLNQIFVFDPILFDDPPSKEGGELTERYSQCFAPQMHGKIQFQPPSPKSQKCRLGTFEHMVDLFENRPEAILFGVSPKIQESGAELVSMNRTRRNRLGGL